MDLSYPPLSRPDSMRSISGDGDHHNVQGQKMIVHGSRTRGADGSLTSPESAEKTPSIWSSLKWWPTLIGAGFAAFISIDLFSGDEHGGELASIVAASGLVYLAAAALHKPSAAWPIFLLSVVVITLSKFGAFGFDATWLFLAAAIGFVCYALLRSRGANQKELPLQAVGMILFGAAAAVALYLDEKAGAYLVATGLLGHAAWDVYHHRTHRAVARSLAEFCFVLDTALALAILVATMRT